MYITFIIPELVIIYYLISWLQVVKCDMYRYIIIDISIFSFNIMIQYYFQVYWYTSVDSLVNMFFSNLPNFIPKSNYNKLVCTTLIDFFYHFLTNTTKQNIYLRFISTSIIISNTCIVILYPIMILWQEHTMPF